MLDFDVAFEIKTWFDDMLDESYKPFEIGNGIVIEDTDGGRTMLLGHFGGTDGILGTYTNQALQIRTNNTARIIIDTSGNTSIGYTTNPSLYLLDVNGTGRFSGNLQATTAAQTTFSLISTETSGRTWSFHTAGTTYGSGAGSFVLRNNGTDALVFNSSSAATFS